MKQSLSMQELICISSMLFGLFFGAGNLIFPVHLGQMAGSSVWEAALGFIITGVGIPILGVAAIGITRSNGLQDLANKVGTKYSIFFTCLLYLTIGPFFAIPRCATVPFAMGIAPMLPGSETMSLGIFTLLFFLLVLFFSLKPQGILTWVGKILNPVFLVFLSILFAVAFTNPMSADISSIVPDESYTTGVIAKGFLEGYNTMDAMASLAFGIIIVQAVRSFGIKDGASIARNTVFAGIFSGAVMAFIYLLIMLMGAMSRGCFQISENGSIALAQIAGHYFGTVGTLFLACIATFACLKTAIGLITSCSASFEEMFPQGPGYRLWAIIFVLISFGIANIGLTAIISYSIPVLMFLYPLSITLIATALLGNLFAHNRLVYVSVTAFTVVAAFFDLVNTLPSALREQAVCQQMLALADAWLPLFAVGLGWVVPAIAGLALGVLVLVFYRRI